MTKIKTIQELAKEVLNNLETKKRTDGQEFVALKNRDIEWHVDLCRDAHPHGLLPDDYVYREIQNALNTIADCTEETPDSIREDVLCSVEPDIYTSDLLEWVASNSAFTDYCDRALFKYGMKGFVDAISMGNHLFKTDVYNSVLDSLIDKFNEQE